jgi:hypothetical protein
MEGGGGIMFYYAQLNENSICISINTSTNIISQPDMISIDSFDEDKLYRKYQDSQWSDEKYPEGFVPTIEEYAQLKAQELLSTCYAKIYDKFTIWDKWFACDTTARDDINDLYYAYQKPDFMGRYWFTAGGLDVVYITPEMVIPFKDAVVEWKDTCWNRYAYLSNQLKLVDLKDPNSKKMIDAIVW